jgi:hypothetical protein
VARRNPRSAQTQAVRTVVDELEAGSRPLTPRLVKAFDQVLEAAKDEEHYEELSPEEWERVWGKEIARRLKLYKAGKMGTVKLGPLLAELRKQLT